MSTELWVVSGLVILSVIGIAWPTIVEKIRSVSASGPSRSPDAFQRRMDLVNELLRECEGCPEETKAVIQAGDVIAEHWREDISGGHNG